MVNGRIHGRLDNLNANDTNVERDIFNEGTRIAISEIDFRGNIRESVLTPNLMDNQYDYDLPNDVKGDGVIDLRPQVTDSRGEFEIYSPVPPEEFDRRKRVETGIYTYLNDDLTRTLRVSADVEDETLVISELDGANYPDTWDVFGGTLDANVKTDGDDFIQGNGATRFSDTALNAASGLTDTSIGIENRSLGPVDVSPFLSKGSFFYYMRLDTGDSGIQTAYLRLGSDSNNFHQFSDSTQNDCSAFQSNWNLVRFDIGSRVTT